MELDQTKLVAIREEVDQFLYNNQVIEIKTKEDYQSAGDTLKVIKMKISKIEDKRKEYTAPLLEQKKLIDDDFKSMSKPLEEFVEAVKTQMLKWHTEEQKRADAEQKKLEAEALVTAKKENKLEVVVPVVNEIKTQKGDLSTTTVKKVWTYEVENELEVPREYLMVDEKKISQAVKDGIREIKGVKIYQKDQLSIR